MNNPEARFWRLERSVAAFLADPNNEDFMVVQTSTLQCNYVQLRISEGDYGEMPVAGTGIAPTAETDPLIPSKEAAIAAIRFDRGGPERNYEVQPLARETESLAHLLELAVIAACKEQPSLRFGVYFKRRAALQDALNALATRLD